MVETVPVPGAAAAPVKATKKKPAAKPKKPAGLIVSDLIVKAVSASSDRRGVSLAMLKKCLIADGYDVEKNNYRVKVAVKRLVTRGVLVQTKGTGASGSFKVNNKEAKKPAAKKAAAPIAKKPAAKKPAAVKKASPKKAKKPAAKKPVAVKKTTPKKVKRPAATKKAIAKSPKKVSKSPKRAAKPAAKKTPAKKVTKPKAAKKAAPKKK